MLYNSDFLKKLDENRTKTTYAKIIALSFNEDPLETIEGRITQGSVNIDGDSAVRRSCSLTMVADNFDYRNYLWGLNTKFKLEVGLENTIDSTYPKIIWFKQGTYFISSFNTSSSTNNFTISIQGKDKMCGLNGEVGGSIVASTDFGTIEEMDSTGVKKIIHLPLKDIIRNTVHLYGGEPEHNIIINDLDMSGLELLEYRYDEDTPLYFYKEEGKDKFDNVIIGNSMLCSTTEEGELNVPLSELENEYFIKLLDPFVGVKDAQSVWMKTEGGKKQVYLAKVLFGDTAGYRLTDLTYPGDLIGNVGESLTSILDKIKNMLGNYEYFYNLDGQFVFQQKKTYTNSPWSPLMNDSEGRTYMEENNSIAYEFKNGELVTTFNNNPNLQNLRNDFAVWGSRTSVSGQEIPVHMRYAIDIKPIQYKSIPVAKDNNTTDTNERDPALISYNNKHGTNVDGQDSKIYSTSEYDWREIIYQMGRDYYKYAHILDDFEARLIKENPQFINGKTGYENYYQDLISFWRDLYDPTLSAEDKADLVNKETTAKNNVETQSTSVKNAAQAVDKAKKDLEKAEQKDEVNQSDIADCTTILNEAKDTLQKAEKELDALQTELTKIQNALMSYENYYYEGEHKYWNKIVYEAPQNLSFWFDFLDGDGALSQFSVKNVGCRPKSINDSNVKAIYFRETPNVIFSNNIIDALGNGTNYTYIGISKIYENTMFSISSQGKSAKSVVDELLYKHSYCIDSATINTIPIYYLEPNTRIQIIDQKTNLDGYYTISKMTIPLTYNGTMSITATRAADLLM